MKIRIEAIADDEIRIALSASHSPFGIPQSNSFFDVQKSAILVGVSELVGQRFY